VSLLLQITGQRNWDDWTTLVNALNNANPECIVQGDARGADLMSRKWAEINGVNHIDMPANWELYGKSAGPIRNREMLRYTLRMSPAYDQCYVMAFIDEARYGPSKGTADMIRASEQAGLNVVRVSTKQQCTVHNLKHERIQKGDVYIGRAASAPSKSILGHTGYWGNPFVLGPNEPRGSSITKYIEYVHKRIDEDPEFRKRLEMLKGKRIFCFCHPQPCHGHVLADIVNSL
jgi:uncharacterized protein DUF4326/SLOG family YspA-like protein